MAVQYLCHLPRFESLPESARGLRLLRRDIIRAHDRMRVVVLLSIISK
jgi:hypothetical protein